MRKYALTPLAKADVDAILSYIDAESEDAGDRVEQAIFDACQFVADGPLRGHLRSDLTKRNLRFWTLTGFPRYLVVYIPGTRPLRIIAVLHGMRNAKRIVRTRL